MRSQTVNVKAPAYSIYRQILMTWLSKIHGRTQGLQRWLLTSHPLPSLREF